LAATIFVVVYFGLNTFYFGFNKIYKAEVTAIFHGPATNSFKAIIAPIEKANCLCGKTNLSSILSIPDDVAINICKVESYHIIDLGGEGIPDIVDYDRKHNMKDTVDLLMYDRMQLAVFTTDITKVDLFEEHLYKYLNSHPSLVNMNKVKHKELNEKLQFTEREIERIDSMASIVYLEKNKPQINLDNNRLLIGEQRRQIFSNDLLELHTIKTKVAMELIDYDEPVSFLSNFVVDPLPVNRKIKYPIYTLFGTYLVSVLICILIDNRKRIVDYLKGK
jgi:hypothetical protein